MADRPPRLAVCVSLVALAIGPLLAQERGIARVPAPVGPKGQIEDLYTESHALLIGVSHYDDRVTWPALESVANELGNLEDALRAQSFQSVQRIMNPTGKALREAIEAFIKTYGYHKGNRLFFFFSGHGYTLDGDGFFVPSDAPDPTRDEPGFRGAALSMRMIKTWAGDITARHALFAFDSCFSGTIFGTRGERPVVQRLSATTAKPVRQFLSAGGAEDPVPAQSVFTPKIVEALSGVADVDGDGFVTGTELGNYVQRKVIAEGAGQTPQFGRIGDLKLDVGDIVFLSRPKAETSTRAPAAASTSVASSVTRDRANEEIASADKTAIEALLNEYRRAYEARDLSRLLRVFPSLPDPETVAKTFADAREVRMGMSTPAIRITSPTEASATSGLSQRLTLKVGLARTAPTRNVTFTLRNESGRWVIASLR